jgi:hypothetical protein
LGKGPTPPVPIDPANRLIFNGLGHFFTGSSVRKNTTFFLQDKGPDTILLPLLVRRYIYQRTSNGCILTPYSELYWYIYQYNSRSDQLRLSL